MRAKSRRADLILVTLVRILVTFVTKAHRFMSKPNAKARTWHPEQIKAAIRMRGTTLSKLATDNELSESACRAALIRPTPAAEKIIAAFLDVPLQQLWPDRYDRDGRRLRARHVRDENNRVRAETHRQFAGAR